MAVVFLDTETTGLSLDDDIWEFAAIRREIDGSESTTHLFIRHDGDKCVRLPREFLDDHRKRWPGDVGAYTRVDATDRIAELFHDQPHIVGAVPNFDTERLARMLADNGIRPGWHYHLIDVENLAVGYLAAKGIYAELPWDSDELSRALGVEVIKEDRHTAMGDVRWAMRIYDTVMGKRSPVGDPA